MVVYFYVMKVVVLRRKVMFFTTQKMLSRFRNLQRVILDGCCYSVL